MKILKIVNPIPLQQRIFYYFTIVLFNGPEKWKASSSMIYNTFYIILYISFIVLYYCHIKWIMWIFNIKIIPFLSNVLVLGRMAKNPDIIFINYQLSIFLTFNIFLNFLNSFKKSFLICGQTKSLNFKEAIKFQNLKIQQNS